MTSELIDVIVTRAWDETRGVRAFRLARMDGADFDAYPAGAHVDVVSPTGVTRQYSLCGNPRERSEHLIAVKLELESRGGSAGLHRVVEGTKLQISHPRSLIGIVERADHHVLVAGGIGITPMLSMAHELAAAGSEFTLHYFARSRDDAAFVDVLSREAFAARTAFWFNLGPEEVGPAVDEALSGLTMESAVYVCGPAPFMEVAAARAVDVVGLERVHVEHFVAQTIDATTNKAFEVELDTGEVFTIPADRSIVSVLNEAGMNVPTSCEEGVCGSCVSGVLKGVPDHRDNCLSNADRATNQQMALCVSRAETERLIIELF